MSMVEHCINGYGIEFDCRDGKNTTVNKIEKMLSETIELKKEINEWFNDMDISNEEKTVDLYSEFEQDYRCGIPAIIAFAITEEFEKKIKIEFLRDDNGKIFIFYCTKNPWEMNDCEKGMTKEKLKSMFEKYYTMLYDEKPIVEDVSIYNIG